MDLKVFSEMLLNHLDDGRITQAETKALNQWLHQEEMTWEGLAALRNVTVEIFQDLLKRMQNPLPTEEATNVLNGMARVIETLWKHGVSHELPMRKDTNEAFFSPLDNLADVITAALENAMESVCAAVYTITYDPISRALRQLHDRSLSSGRPVQIRIISDDEKVCEPGSDIWSFCRCSGMQVRVDESFSQMHHKFAVIDGKTLINGSFNWTQAAATKNYENLTVTTDKRIVNMFLAEFERVWIQCTPLKVSDESRFS